jgi:Transposase DDE domain group 1
LRVKHGSRLGSLQIAADQSSLVSRSGSALVSELAARLGLEGELSGALAHLFRRRPQHDPGRVLVDLATTLIDGGDCVCDLGALAEQPDLFGSVASHSTATRLLHALGEAELAAIRLARRAGRERAWALGARPTTITLDFDGQLLECHTEKEGAAPHRKGGFGFHPLHCFLDETGEQLAALLRPGNAGANTAADHVAVLDAALAQLPDDVRDRERGQPPAILARADSAGATHDFAAALRQRKIRFSLGYYVDERVGEAALALPKRRWRRALNADGSPRSGAWVAELSGRIDLSRWPEGTRLIVRKERPHPGAQLRFSDTDGHRYQCFITDQNDKQIAQLERRHRLHARVEDRIQESQELGLGRLPFQALAPNRAWFELTLLAQDLLAWLRRLALDGELALAKPKRLRGRLLHVAGRITHSGRRRTLHLPRAWPWAADLLAAFARLRAITAPG